MSNKTLKRVTRRQNAKNNNTSLLDQLYRFIAVHSKKKSFYYGPALD